jgi:hypothetical protein
MQNFILYDLTSGITAGTMALPDNSLAPMPNAVFCSQEQADEFFKYKVDLSGDVPVLVALSAEDQAALMQETLRNAVQKILDAKAQEYRYDNIASAVTYADEPSVLKFQAEGKAFRAWRSLVWDAVYTYLADVLAGKKSFPTKEELPGLLPPFNALTVPTE